MSEILEAVQAGALLAIVGILLYFIRWRTRS